MRLFAFLFTGILLYSCGNAKKNTPEDAPVETMVEVPDSDIVAETKEPDAVPRVENFSWDEAPLRERLSDVDRAWIGTIVGEVPASHINTGGVAFLNKSGSNDLVESTMDAIDNDTRADQCIWMELYNDRTGFWFSCLMMDDEPRVTEKIDILHDNARVTTGVMFDWYVKGKSIFFRFEQELVFTWEKDGEKHDLRTRYWTIQLPSATPKTKFKGKDIYPEYGYTSPVQSAYEFYAEHSYGKPQRYESSVMLK